MDIEKQNKLYLTYSIFVIIVILIFTSIALLNPELKEIDRFTSIVRYIKFILLPVSMILITKNIVKNIWFSRIVIIYFGFMYGILIIGLFSTFIQNDFSISKSIADYIWRVTPDGLFINILNIPIYIFMIRKYRVT